MFNWTAFFGVIAGVIALAVLVVVIMAPLIWLDRKFGGEAAQLGLMIMALLGAATLAGFLAAWGEDYERAREVCNI